MTSQHHKRSWKNYLINARVQLRFALLMVGACALLMGGVGYMVMDAAHLATKVSIQQVESNEAYLENAQAEIEHLRRRERLTGQVLLCTGMFLCLGLFLYGIKMTHRVAGPLYKISGHLDKVRQGHFDPVFSLRKGDQLTSFFEHFKEAHEALRRREQDDVATLRELISVAERDGLPQRSRDIAASLEELRSLLRAKETSLG
ncbi:MAG: hypothetical protein HY698_09530 [Deltaproteobacteria bacterium]|nr:hypothetical protein [Deltaproteobacteria bacterium]